MEFTVDKVVEPGSRRKPRSKKVGRSFFERVDEVLANGGALTLVDMRPYYAEGGGSARTNLGDFVSAEKLATSLNRPVRVRELRGHNIYSYADLPDRQVRLQRAVDLVLTLNPRIPQRIRYT